MPGSSWERLLRLRQPADDGDPQTVVTVYLDNTGGLVLFMDEGDGKTVIGVPLSDDHRQKLAEVLMSKEPA